MKITKDDFIRLRKLINEIMVKYYINSSQYYAISKITYVWKIYYITLDSLQSDNRIDDYLFIRSLGDYLNDDNLTTALKRILPE